MAYAVGQTIEVCLEFDLPPARGMRRVVAAFANGRGDIAGLTEVPAAAAECALQEPGWAALRGTAAHPGSYELKSLRVEHLRGITHVDPPRIGFEVRGAPEVVRWRLR